MIKQPAPTAAMPASPAMTAAQPAAAAGVPAGTAAGLAAGDDRREIFARLVRPIARIAGAQAGAMRLFDSRQRSLCLVGEHGLPQPVLATEREVPHDCGACGQALAGDKPVWADDVGVCIQRNRQAYFGHECQRVLALPVRHHGQVLGVLSLFFDGGPAPAPDMLALLESIGELIGAALQDHQSERAALLDERQAMAADLHDSIGQSLAFARMRLPLLHDAIEARDTETAQRYFEDVRATVGQAHSSLRGILTHLRTPMQAQGLAQALQASAEAFRRQGGFELELVNDLPGLQMTPEQEAPVFHIVQEALSNVARHAAARHARVHIAPAGDGAAQVVVEDDGAGLTTPAGPNAPGAQGSHYGMEIMRERARRLGGVLEVGPRPGGGTRVRLTFPLRADAAPESR